MAANDLTTLAVFKDYAQIDTGDTTADATINRLITWASGVIRSYLQRSITIPTVTEQRTLFFEEEKSKLLEDKVTDITEVLAPLAYLVEGEPYSTDLIVVEYEYEQSNAFTRIMLPVLTTGIVQITGTWGWTSPPSDLEYACTIQVDEWFRGNVQAVWNPPDQGEEKRQEISGALSDQVKEVLEPWTFDTRVV